MKRTDRLGHPRRSTPATPPAPAAPTPPATLGANRESAATATTITPGRTIDLHIAELVLHGFSPVDRQPIADAVVRALSEMFSRDELGLDRSAELDFVSGAFRVPPAGRPETTGAGIARAIYGGLRS